MIQYKLIIVIFLLFITLFELYKRYREYKTYTIKTIPTEVKEIYGEEINQEEFEKSQNYHKELTIISIIENIYNFIINMITYTTPLLSIIWNNCQFINGYVSSMITMIVISFISELFDLPFSLYVEFGIRKKYELTKMTVKTYFKDKTISFIISNVLNCIICSALYFFSETSNLCFYLWIAILLLNVFFTLIFTPFIVPLFFKKSPLEEGELKEKVEMKLKEVDFPLKSVCVIDASSKQKEGNAFFSGLLGKRDLVLYDNLITSSTNEEIVDIVLHEVGHSKHHHIYKLLAVQLTKVYFILKFIETFLFDDNLYQQFGFTDKPVVIGFSLLETLLIPFMEILAFVSNVLTRKFEYQADEFSVKNGFGHLDSALIKLNKNNLGSFIIDPFISTIEHSHPTIIERVKAIRKLKEEKNK